ncbi:CRISPR-associated ring nuclease Crn3/Csx3 [Vacuolonema iberomarrocanum]|uniref:CRISPR-associated ring nuclease Crn3/Csx3 n=1 Tax=Vacuolonema iberomarrocanum TaxID=3454632 RepID=UPI0019ECDD9F|nr:CRISPR-associated protein Csx3 [filamentous cyanobacterium LEGE 07170]
MTDIAFHLVSHKTEGGLPYQHLHVKIATPTGIITPAALKSLTLPDTILWSQGVVIEGKLPLWLSGYLIHACHPAAWVACFDPRLGDAVPHSGGAVVVATHSPQVAEGDVLIVTIPDAIH